jgi:hypothetical protein
MNSFPISTYHCIRLCATSWVTGKEEKYLSFGTISVLPLSNPSRVRRRVVQNSLSIWLRV